MLLRFLADSSDYYDYLKGINNLTDSQKQVLYERLKSELPMTQSTPIQSLSLPTTANTTIRAALPDSDKPTYTIDCCLHCGSTVIKKIGKTKGGMQGISAKIAISHLLKIMVLLHIIRTCQNGNGKKLCGLLLLVFHLLN